MFNRSLKYTLNRSVGTITHEFSSKHIYFLKKYNGWPCSVFNIHFVFTISLLPFQRLHISLDEKKREVVKKKDLCNKDSPRFNLIEDKSS